MREFEIPVHKEFANLPPNAKEFWPIYDSIVICEELIGSEVNVPGWFTTFANFAAKETHVFFKNRTDGIAGEQYTNMKNGDTMDFAYLIHSVGIAVFCTPGFDCQVGAIDGTGLLADRIDAVIPQYWRADFPWHLGIQLKVQQDVRLELPVMAACPGYGESGGGTAYQQAYPVPPLPNAFGEVPWIAVNSTQGVPVLKNRFPLPEPIGVPRTGSVEMILHVGEWARLNLQQITGPHRIFINVDGTESGNFYYSRYIIQASLFGERMVQRRAQYHR